MEKRTLYAIVVMAVFGIVAFSALRAPEKGQRTGPAPRPIPEIKAGDITRLEVTSQKDEHTTLERKDGAWHVAQPSDWPADAQAVKALVEALEKMRFGDVVTENPAKHESLGVADKGSVHVKLTAGPTTAELILGQTVGGFLLGRLGGKNEVWQLSNIQPFLANKAPKDWRDHVVVPLVVADVDKITVEVPGGSKLVLEKVPAADKATQPTWKILESTGDAPKAGDVLDLSQPNTVVQALASMRAADFADGKDEKEAGLAPPALLVSATAQGKTQTLELGAQNNEDVFVRVTGSPTIFVVKKYMLDRVQYRPIDYRDKTLLHDKIDDVARVRVVQGKDETVLVHKDTKWTLGAGAEVDEAKAKILVGGVDNLVAQSFLTDKAVKTELDKPRAQVTVETKAGKKTTLKVGGLTKDQGDYYVALEGGKDVFLAKKFAVDRLLKKPADLTAVKAPAKK